MMIPLPLHRLLRLATNLPPSRDASVPETPLLELDLEPFLPVRDRLDQYHPDTFHSDQIDYLTVFMRSTQEFKRRCKEWMRNLKQRAKDEDANRKDLDEMNGDTHHLDLDMEDRLQHFERDLIQRFQELAQCVKTWNQNQIEYQQQLHTHVQGTVTNAQLAAAAVQTTIREPNVSTTATFFTEPPTPASAPPDSLDTFASSASCYYYSPREHPGNPRSFCLVRELCLLDHNFGDIFATVKDAENSKAIAILPQVLTDLDKIQADSGMEVANSSALVLELLKGILAGNIFDLGAADSANRFHQNHGIQFNTVKAIELKPRPWLIDDADTIISHLVPSPSLSTPPPPQQQQHQQPPSSFFFFKYETIIIFADNAGADVILGIIPFARYLLSIPQVQHVVIAANHRHSINDITAAELQAILAQICECDPHPRRILQTALQQRRLSVVSSGNALPVIDLRMVSSQLNHVCRQVKMDRLLVVLEGMGRSIETNLHQTLACDSIRIGMIKHAQVAAALQGTLYECVVRFWPGHDQQQIQPAP